MISAIVKKTALLSAWIGALDEMVGQPGREIEVAGVVMDSRQVQPRSLFVAVSGGASDGHRYIPAAIQAGACAVVGTQPLENLAVPCFQVRDSRLALAQLAAAFHGFPAHPSACHAKKPLGSTYS